MSIPQKIKKNLFEYKRILSISKKPTTEEYIRSIKVSAMGIGLIGIMGFLIQLLGAFL